MNGLKLAFGYPGSLAGMPSQIRIMGRTAGLVEGWKVKLSLKTDSSIRSCLTLAEITPPLKPLVFSSVQRVR